MIKRFSDFELDEELFPLRRAGEGLALEPKAFDLFVYLAEYLDRVVSKQELLREVGSGQIVSESVLPTHIRSLRRVLGEDRAEQRFLQTVYARGYRFVGTLELPPTAAAPEIAARVPFVGREAILADLQASLDAAALGRGSLSPLAGEPGIRKTRTAQEITHRAVERGFRVPCGRKLRGRRGSGLLALDSDLARFFRGSP